MWGELLLAALLHTSRPSSLASSSSRATALNTGGAEATLLLRCSDCGTVNMARRRRREALQHRSIHSLLKISDTPFDFPHNTWPLSLPGMAEKGRGSDKKLN